MSRRIDRGPGLSLIATALVLAGSGASEALAQEAAASLEPGPIRSGPNLAPFPRGNPGYWINSNSYPEIALRNGWQGKVVIALKINRWGVVADCTVQESSGYKLLDEATCAALANRARFDPATDAKGEPTDGIYLFPVNWSLPEDTGAYRPADPAVPRTGYPRPPVPKRYWSTVYRADYPDSDFSARHRGTTMVNLTVGKDGTVSNCTVRRSSGFASLDAATCRIMRERALFYPALDLAGEATTGSFIDGINWNPERTVQGSAGSVTPPSNPVPTGAWQPTLDLAFPASARMQFVLTADGELRDCRVEGDAGSPALRETYRLCDNKALSPQTRYHPFRTADGTARSVQVSVETTIKVSDAPAPAAGP